jgi:anti-anti-sigma factor
MEHSAYIDVTTKGTIRLVLAGSLILVRHDDVLEELDRALKAEPSPQVSIDLTDVTSLDSSGIALLLLARRHARRAGRTFHLHGTQPEVMGHLHLAGLTVFLGLHPPDDTARSRTADAAAGAHDGPDGRAASLIEILDEPFDFERLSAIRQQLSRYAAGSSMPEHEQYKLLLAATEVMTNAVRHGGGSGRIVVTGRDSRIFLEISDRGHGIPRRFRERPRPRPGRIGLYGLWLVRQICERVDIDTGPGGTTVRLTFAFTPAD